MLPGFGGAVQILPGLPNTAIANAVQVDSAGNIYLAGEFQSNPQITTSPFHAFVEKLSPDGSQIFWLTPLAGSQSDHATALALGADNSVYVIGNTTSTDFPTTPGSMQPTTSVSGQPFAAKLNPAGGVVYSTYIGGTASGIGIAIAIDSSGDAFITGLSSNAFPTTPGAVSGATNALSSPGYVVELNPAGSAAVVGINGFGGYAIAVDAQGNIYAAGAFVGPGATTSPGAFQSTATMAYCFSSFSLDSLCTNQHIAKIDPTGTKLLYATYIAGSYGAIPSAIAVDAQGNAIVAGTTNSPDYPTTPLAYQPEYFGYPSTIFFPPHEFYAPDQAGYVTKLNAIGTGLIWSTFFGGSGTLTMLPGPLGGIIGGDSISSMNIDSSGNILLAGSALSSDLPGLWLTPVASRPTALGEGFVTRLSADGSTLSPTELVAGSKAVSGIAARSDGSSVIVPALATVSISSVGRVAAIADTADNAKIVRVAPGQLLTLYGTNLAPTPAFRIGTSGLTTSLAGVTVTFNSIPAPILYTSGIQINLQVPYEIAGLTEVTMQVSSQQVTPPVSESYILAVAAGQPSVFLTSNGQAIFDLTSCNGQNFPGLQPLTLNADGTQNSCANPAASGSVVTIFLNGIGVSSPMQATGMTSTSAVAIEPAGGTFGSTTGTNFLSTTTLAGSIDSVAEVQIQVSSTSTAPLSVPLDVEQESAGGYWVRGTSVLIWVRP